MLDSGQQSRSEASCFPVRQSWGDYGKKRCDYGKRQLWIAKR